MKIVIPEIDPQEALEKDIFERKSFGQALINLVERSDDELVISLDGQWGEGKTTFVKMWQIMLDQNDIPNVYIDAFANDHMDDPFITVVSAITEYADKNVKKDTAEKLKDLKNKAVKVGSQLAISAAKVGVGMLTSGMVDADGFINQKMENHKDSIATLKEFRNELSVLPSLLNDEKEKPFVIIIDELDRCRPTYAVEMLEKIKHLFSVKKIVFVLVMNREQLKEAITNIYGTKDSHAYLQKFINVETKLPALKESRDYISDIAKYCEKLFELHEIKFLDGSEYNLEKSVTDLAMFFNLSLRELERVTTSLVLVCLQYERKNRGYLSILAFLAIAKVKYPSVFEGILKGNMNYFEIEKITGSLYTESLESSYVRTALGYIRLATLSRDARDALVGHVPFKDSWNGVSVATMKQEVIKLSEQLSMFNVTYLGKKAE